MKGQISSENGLLVLIFTPKNSIEAVHHLNEIEGEYRNICYYRTSKFDPNLNLHTNSLKLLTVLPANQTWIEEHQQRAYELEHMKKILNKSP